MWTGSVLFALLRSPQHLQRTNQRTVWERMFLGIGAECGLEVSACGKCIALVFRYETSHFRKFTPFFSLWASCFSSLFSICLSVSLSCHLFLSGLDLWYFHLMQSGSFGHSSMFDLIGIQSIYSIVSISSWTDCIWPYWIEWIFSFLSLQLLYW